MAFALWKKGDFETIPKRNLFVGSSFVVDVVMLLVMFAFVMLFFFERLFYFGLFFSCYLSLSLSLAISLSLVVVIIC